MIRKRKCSSVSDEGILITISKRPVPKLRISNLNNICLCHKLLKKEVNVTQSDPQISIWIDSPVISFKFSSSQVNILVSQELPFAKGCRVERMGRHGWRGTITAIEDEMAFVNWGFHRTWVSISELYPLDSRDQPCFSPKRPSLIEISRRARVSLKSLMSEMPSENIQGKLFD